MGRRGRSREPREWGEVDDDDSFGAAYEVDDDDGGGSFESLASDEVDDDDEDDGSFESLASDDESYEPVSDPKIQSNISTDSMSSVASHSEPPNYSDVYEEEGKKDKDTKRGFSIQSTITRIKNSKCYKWCGCSDIMEGKTKWYILGLIILTVIGIILARVLRKDDVVTISVIPTSAPTVSESSTPSLGQVTETISIFALIPNGKEIGISEEELEVEFSAVFGNLTSQISTSDGLRGRHRCQNRTKLDGESVRLPISVDVAEIVCPDTASNPQDDMCVRVDIILNTDDCDIGFDYYEVIEDAIETEKLLAAFDSIGSNLVITILDEEIINATVSPTKTPSPTISPQPTISPIPTSSCSDNEDSCEAWANQDPSQCQINPAYMELYCTKACGLCVTDSPTTASPTNSLILSPADLTSAPSNNSTTGSLSNLTSVVPSFAPTAVTSDDNATYDSLMPFDDSELESNATLPNASSTNSTCINNDARCTEWAAENQCTINPGYMLINCRLSCQVCSSESDEQESQTPSTCFDLNDRCAEWAANDECSNNPGYMLDNCRLSCDVCEDETIDDVLVSLCDDDNDRCEEWAANDECTRNPNYMQQNCKASCGVCENSNDSECKDLKEDCYGFTESGVCSLTKCAFWARNGECEKNPTYMIENCSKSCGTC